MIPLIASLIMSGAGSAMKQRDADAAAQEMNDYNRNMGRFNKKELARQERAQRLSTLLRIMGYSDANVAKHEYGDQPEAPVARGPGMGDTLQAVGGALGQLSANQMEQEDAGVSSPNLFGTHKKKARY